MRDLNREIENFLMFKTCAAFGDGWKGRRREREEDR